MPAAAQISRSEAPSYPFSVRTRDAASISCSRRTWVDEPAPALPMSRRLTRMRCSKACCESDSEDLSPRPSRRRDMSRW